jgi:hypothetical protein
VLTIEPKAAETATSIYAFTPEGVAFEVDATLSISTDGVTIPAEMKAVLASRDGASWAEIPGSTDVSGAVEAPVSKLAAFSLILADASGPCDPACMAQADAVCCTTCGCEAAVPCAPQCDAATPWDCEIQCCFDYDKLECAP